MKSAAWHLTRCYDRILQLYPSRFRLEFGDEMRTVFQLQLDSCPVSSWGAIRILWGELRPLPGLLLSAYWRERRNSPMKTGLECWFVQPEGSWKELVLAGLPFLMFALPGVFSLFPAIVNLPLRIGITIISLMALTLIGVGIIGLFVRLPRWSLVYAGAFLTLCTLGGLAVIANFGNLPINWSALTTTTIFLGIHLVLQFGLVAGIVSISGKIPLTTDFHNQVKADPSLISLMMYGGTLMVMVANFEDVAGVDWYLIAAAIAMLLGVWGYLRTDNLRGQLLALMVGNTAAAALGLAANLILVDTNTPPLIIGGIEVERVIVFIALTWLTSLVMILLPVVVFSSRSEPVAT
ncbi:MAG: hypothetical protein JW757_07470 [Anaerolineales bacterium]|nr:hypothetical protein [Anaerolineales bacterium]